MKNICSNLNPKWQGHEMKKVLLTGTILVVFIAVIFLTACSGQTPGTTGLTGSPYSTGSQSPGSTTSASAASTGSITVGSKIDTEGGLLAQMIILMLQKNGIQTVDKSQLGPTQIVRQALLSGQIDLYPEYTGNGAIFFPNVDPTIWKNAQQGYNEAKTLDQKQNNIIWLEAAPANNTWAIAIPKNLSDKENLHSLDDFAAYVNRGGTVKLAASDEFVTSAVALPAFEKAYNFTLTQSQLLTFSGGNTAQTEKASADGTSGVNAAMAYGTDGSLAALKLIVLDDPKGVQPVYEPAPIVRGTVYVQYPQMASILNPVFQSLSLTVLQTLNSQIALKGQSAMTTAQNYLTSKGFLK
jgi:osmoprotectant transport system substrate-binding protein